MDKARAIDTSIKNATIKHTTTRRRTMVVVLAVATLLGAAFARVTGAEAQSGFSDVPSDAFYTAGVTWMTSNGITKGVGGGRFAPNDAVNRAQMAAFLHRLVDSPAGSPAHGFTDVDTTAFYNDSVSWLKNTGVTTGTTPSTYGPLNPVTRAEMAAFLHRMAGKPAPPTPHSFSDIPAGVFYDSAVSWMAATGVTKGVGNGRYAPASAVTRGEMAAFIYRFDQVVPNPPVVSPTPPPTTTTTLPKPSFPVGTLFPVAGTLNVTGNGGDGDAATSATFDSPHDLAVASNGDIYISDFVTNRIRRVTALNGKIDAFAGSGNTGYSGDGSAATNANLKNPVGIAVANNGDVYFSDHFNHVIRKVAADGNISTVAGTPGMVGFGGDGGDATSAKFDNPEHVVIGPDGDLYISDFFNDRIRKVDLGTGKISTYQNKDLGMHPSGMAFDASGNLFVAAPFNHKVLRITPGGVVTVAAGSGSQGFDGDNGAPTTAKLSSPDAVAFDSKGQLYISEKGNNRIRMVGTDNKIRTVAGNGDETVSGTGNLATNAGIDPDGIAIHNDVLYLAESGGRVVRGIVLP